MTTSQKNHVPSQEQQILDTSSFGMMITQVSDDKILYANQAIANLLGISDIGKLIGKKGPNFYWEANDYQMLLEQFRAKGGLTNHELRARHADGSMFWISISVRHFDFQGKQALLSEIIDITERKQAEEALRQTQALYQSLVEVSPMSICRKDLAGRFTFANQRFLELSQTTLADLVGKTDFDLHPSELADKYRRDDLAVMESGQVEEFVEERMVHEGETTYVETIKTPIYDEAGKVNGIQISFWDITDRMRAEEDLLLRDRALASSVNAVIIIRLSDNKNIYLNDALLKMTGYTREEAMRLTFADIAADPGEMKKIQSAINAQGFFSGEEFIKRKDGSFFPTSFSNTLIKDAKGRPFAIQSSFFDITERKQAEQAQKESEERFRSLYNNATIGLYRTTPDGQILMINPTGLQMLGFDTFEELAKRNLEQAGFEEVDARKNFREKLEREGIIELDSVWTKKDGTPIFVRESSTVSRDENGNVLYYDGSFEDITASKQAEEALRTSEERFKRFTEATVEGLVFHEQGKIIDANPAILNIFGISDRTDFIGGNILDFIVPESHKLVMQQMQLEFVQPYEIQCIRKDDGSIFPVETSTRAYHDGNRVIRASSIRDITERKQAEQALQDNRRLLQLVMDNIPQAVFWKDKELTYLGANQAFAEDAGLALAQDLVDKTDFDMPWKEQAELYRADDQKVLELGEPKLNYEEPQTGPTGNVTWLRTSKIPMRDGDGKVFAILGMYEDITEWKRLQQQVQEGFERRGYQVQVSTEISQEVAAASELSDLFGRVVTLTKERLGYYHTQLLRYDATRDAVVLINGYGETGQKMLAGGHQMPMGQGLIGTAAASGEAVLRPTLADDPDWHANPLLPDTQGEIAVPIKWQDTVLGVLDVQSDKAGALTEDDRLMLEGICGQVAIAMHSAELVEAIRQNEAKLSEALLAARLANWEYDVEKDIFTFNDEFYSIFHTTVEKAGGYQLSSARYAELFVHPDDMEVVGIEIGKALSSTERVYNTSIDHRIRYEDGGVGYITVKLTVERDENGKITRYYGANQDITERKQAEEALRINETRLAEALRAARLGNWEYDFENDLFIFTDDFYSIFRTTAERVGGYKISSADYSKNFVHPDDAPLVGSEIQKVLDAKDRLFTTHLEHRIIFSDGEIGHIAVNINVERDKNMKIVRWYGANQDITERKQAEEALRVNEARLSEALLAARLANWEYDVEKDIFTFNDQFYSIFHTTAEKVGGYQISSARYAEIFVHPDDMEVVGIEIGKALSSTERVYNTTIDHRIRYEDGGVGYITVKLTVERDENGKITRYYGANQDITERKQAEEALRMHEARLAEALRAARLANWEYDVEKDIFTFNDQFYSLFHLTAEKVGGYQISSARYAELFVHPDDVEIVSSEIGKALSSTERVYNTTIDQRFLYADGGIGYMQVNITVERDENGKITRNYGANQDITERVKQQQELTERLEEINRLYQNLSHEGWKNYRNTADLPAGFMYDQAEFKPVDDSSVMGEHFTNVPMKVLGGEVVGTLTIADDPQNPTSNEDRAFLQQVSDQIALALEGARLSAQTQSALAQSEILFESSRRLAQASDLQELVKTAIETFNIPVINGAELNMFSYDLEGDLESLAVVANWWNGTGKEPGAIGSRYPKAMFSAVKLFLTSTPVFINDTSDNENMDPSMQRIVKAFNIHAATFLPLFVGTHQIGVLVMHAEEPHNFTEEETRLFSGLAPQIATVLENRRQYERAQQQAERESTLNLISQKIQSATTVEAVLQIAARELGHALGAPMTIAQLSMKDKK